ncbi:hypothetical protein PM10SUCC1_02930 [Propionigenium maris DSM 9537]|uniref:Uncharacterized protein n=1 Tax=Propionigenium maris DSM 9537 TaxID=1123000 RepID=A0A9W6GII2_9FUSO|nr:hypothetical protein [Propionigenium maris]GLI54778.1 hypothetical protein PM10SUCC1_02930 [Propionigenium maris DSM 9537]
MDSFLKMLLEAIAAFCVSFKCLDIVEKSKDGSLIGGITMLLVFALSVFGFRPFLYIIFKILGINL